MTKKFSSSTIVPSEMYVRRAADKQLEDIIDNMGRPGYVLVARQMGKTNLLLNMKREQEACGHLVYYVDLSVRHDTARGLFQSIIDGLLELDQEGLAQAQSEISTKRRGVNIEANLEYDRHLRLILRSTPHKIIIILDEVDSLINVPYSDLIFSQIRSMYFSRTNQRDYHRLTYVLSGVAEPTDLIKDKNISPFNIGQKIYLDNFSMDEIGRLVLKAGASIRQDLIQHIYSWTGGNPRMTWDLLAALESSSDDFQALSKTKIDEVINRLYLSRFDLAPVDSIRLAVEQDAELRGSVISIKWGKGETLSDRAKDKLYLSGITTAARSHPMFVNRIVEEALSDDWLKRVATAQPSLTDLATESFNNKSYRKVISLLTEFFAGLESEGDLPFAPMLQLGMAYYYVSNFDQAFDTLVEAIPHATSPELRALTKFYLGASAIQIGALREAREAFADAAKYPGPLTHSSQLGLITVDLNENTTSTLNNCVRTSYELIGSIKKQMERETFSSSDVEILTSAYACLFRALTALKDFPSAGYAMDGAFANAPVSLLPALIAVKVQNNQDDQHNSKLLKSAVQTIIENRLLYSQSANGQLNFGDSCVATLCESLLRYDDIDTATQLLEYVATNIHKRNKTILSAIVDLLNAKNPLYEGTYVRLAWFAADTLFSDATSLHLKLHVYRYLAKYEKGLRENEAAQSFTSIIELGLETNFSFSDEDFIHLAGYATLLLEQKRLQETVQVSRLATRVRQKLPQQLPEYSFMSRFQEFDALQGLGRFEEARVVGTSVVSEIDRAIGGRTDFNQDLLGTMRLMRLRVSEAMNASTMPARNFPPINLPHKIGRNDFVTVRNVQSGIVSTVKFKKVSHLIKSHELVLLSVNTSR